MKFAIGVSDTEMRALRKVLNPQQYRQAMYQATKRSTRKGRVMVGDAVRSRLNLRKKFIDAPTSDKAAIKDRFDKTTQTGTVETKKIGLPLSEFPNTASKGGVTAQIDKTRPALTMRHAFKARVKSQSQKAQGIAGHVGIFTRMKIDTAVADWIYKAWGRTDWQFQVSQGYGPGTTGLTRSKERHGGLKHYNAKGYAWRLPIQERYGITVFDLVKQNEVIDPLVRNIGNLFRDELGNQISRFTGGRIKNLATLVLEAGDTDQ